MTVNGFLFRKVFRYLLSILLKSSITIFAITGIFHHSYGQQNLLAMIFDETHDSTFVVSYDRFITGRVYMSKKYTRLDILDRSANTGLQYRPNTTVNLGIGATYGNFTINMAYGFRFMNPESGRGDTRWLDLQTRVYARKYIVDIYGQFYQGLFLQNTDEVIANPGTLDGPFMLRADIFLQQIGGAASYIFNHKRFSYRASFVQNEWQKRSAGSLLVGFEVYSGLAQGDSSLIPRNTIPPGIFDGKDLKRMSFLEVGPSVGYAHTLVYNENWFLTGHLGVNLALGWLSEYDEDGLNRGLKLYPNLMSRVVAGYNSPKWFFGASYINNSLRFRSNFDDWRYIMDTGNVRINVAHRFVPGPGTRRYLKIVKDFEKSKN